MTIQIINQDNVINTAVESTYKMFTDNVFDSFKDKNIILPLIAKKYNMDMIIAYDLNNLDYIEFEYLNDDCLYYKNVTIKDIKSLLKEYISNYFDEYIKYLEQNIKISTNMNGQEIMHEINDNMIDIMFNKFGFYCYFNDNDIVFVVGIDFA